MNDWTSNSKSTYSILGSSNHSTSDRSKRDYYATDPKAVEALLKVETFSKWIWECACGEGHISKVLEKYGYDVISTDLIYRGFGEKEPFDFLKCNDKNLYEDIITNPPYKYAREFVEKALDVVSNGHKVAMLMKIQFLEGKKRRMFFQKYPPKKIWVFSDRIQCGKNGNFTNEHSAICFAWFIWEKGFNGVPCVGWL